ncbi:NGG1p interacting factor NIF3 [Candidatus Synchoanobacter obligatus]|uniref:NGG1p interacting factor NIF3 n=1 Tax=Candidatus Synchoanobacter obligatus TaxID=2919597 RepID=A0ABT1L5L0_9GAMM|nr:NGG1p interacting factor NIF3 [Candidatus Synchoanobacter obligatus]MCP8352158.1 NGG1p interacting factor NIF3 [Candidatus Synchoanobacter obligatus]
MYKMVFFVPPSHFSEVKTAVLSTGAGRVGQYEHCLWYVLGKGEYRPCEGAEPFLGKAGRLERVEEYRVEVLVQDDFLESAIAALKLAHPYEEAVFEVTQLEDIT